MPDETRVPHHTHEEWSGKNKRLVRQIYGGIVGAAVVFGAFEFGSHVIEDGSLSIVEAVFVAGLAMAGLIAAMPATFMPFIHDAISAWQNRKGGE